MWSDKTKPWIKKLYTLECWHQIRCWYRPRHSYKYRLDLLQVLQMNTDNRCTNSGKTQPGTKREILCQTLTIVQMKTTGACIDRLQTANETDRTRPCRFKHLTPLSCDVHGSAPCSRCYRKNNRVLVKLQRLSISHNTLVEGHRPSEKFNIIIHKHKHLQIYALVWSLNFKTWPVCANQTKRNLSNVTACVSHLQYIKIG